MAEPDRLKTALANRYAIERELGAGGMATVHLAHDVKHDRPDASRHRERPPGKPMTAPPAVPR